MSDAKGCTNSTPPQKVLGHTRTHSTSDFHTILSARTFVTRCVRHIVRGAGTDTRARPGADPHGRNYAAVTRNHPKVHTALDCLLAGCHLLNQRSLRMGWPGHCALAYACVGSSHELGARRIRLYCVPRRSHASHAAAICTAAAAACQACPMSPKSQI